MQEKVKRVAVDTNLWISFLIAKNFVKFEEILYSNKFILLFSQELIAEFLEVARRDKFRRCFAFDEAEKLMEIAGEYGHFVNVTSKVDVCRDDKDNFLLALAVDGKADFLLTGDKDLLTLKTYKETTITTISAFLDGQWKK